MYVSRRACFSSAQFTLRRPPLTWRTPHVRCGAAAAPVERSVSVNVVLERVRRELPWGQAALSRDDELVVFGTGRQLGLDVLWRLRCRSDGSFREDVRAKRMSYAWGHDASAEAAPHSRSTAAAVAVVWERDRSRCSRALELDDREVLLLTSWVRCGLWATEPLSPLLDITLVDQAQLEGLGASSSADGGSLALELRLRGGKVVFQVLLCTSSWRTTGMEVVLPSQAEAWRFESVRDWGNGVLFPALSEHDSGTGGTHSYAVHAARIRNAVKVALQAALQPFSMPPPRLLPSDTSYDFSLPAATPAWRTPSGHLLVRAELDGKQSGYWLLDTGASCCVVEPSVADALGLPAFGEIWVAGVAAKAKCEFRHAATLRVGPLTLRDVLLVGMPCGGIVQGGAGPLMGIIGYELFRRAVVDIPALNAAPRGGITANAKARVTSVASAMAAVLVADMASTGPAPSCSIGIHHPSATEGPVSLSRPLQPSAAPCGASQEDGSSAWNGGTVRSLDAVPAESDQAGDWGSLTAAALWAPDADETAPPGSTAPLSVPPEAWLPLTMLAGLPHVIAEYHTGDAASPPRTALLMLDSGAGGVGVMFGPRAVDEHGLLETTAGKGNASSILRGVGGANGGASSMRVRAGVLEWLRLGTAQFDKVSCLLATVPAGDAADGPDGAGATGLDLSLYSSGIVCGTVLSKCRLVMDLAHGRLAIQAVGKVSSTGN